MKRIDRRHLSRLMLGGTLFGLAGCGFRPVYGTGGSDGGADVMADLAATRIASIEDRDGQILHNLLLDRFNPKGRPANPQHVLTVELSSSQADRGTQIDASVRRAELSVSVSASLSTGETSFSFSSRTVASFSISESDYAAEVARQDAMRRSLVVIADDLRLQAATYFEKQRLLKG